MSRNFSAAFGTAIAASVVEVFFAVEITFSSGPLYVWSGYGDLSLGPTSPTYLGAGQLLQISSVEETTELEAKGASITMSGIPSSFLSLALQEPYQGRPCSVKFGVRLATGAIELVEIFSGELDQMNISESGDTATISITAENILIKLERPVVRRFTEEDQKTRYPADKGLEFVNALQDREIYWGRKSS